MSHKRQGNMEKRILTQSLVIHAALTFTQYPLPT